MPSADPKLTREAVVALHLELRGHHAPVAGGDAFALGIVKMGRCAFGCLHYAA